VPTSRGVSGTCGHNTSCVFNTSGSITLLGIGLLVQETGIREPEVWQNQRLTGVDRKTMNTEAKDRQQGGVETAVSNSSLSGVDGCYCADCFLNVGN
jgi:hypothetical protein